MNIFILFSTSIFIFFTPFNSYGANFKEHYIQVDPKISLRVVRVTSSKLVKYKKNFKKIGTSPKKVILFLPGRGSFVEKNQDFIRVLSGETSFLDIAQTISNPLMLENYDVWIIDYRGHGKSGGRLGDPCNQRCHITTFDDYLKDIHIILKKLILQAYPSSPQITLMGDSLGGLLALRYAELYPSHVSQLILISPMLQFYTHPFPTWMAKFITSSACMLGYSEHYAWGYGPLDLSKSNFSEFKGHHNESTFYETNKLLAHNPQLITAGPTYGWVKAAFETCESTLITQELKKISCPIFIYAAGDDQVVNNNAIKVISAVHQKAEVMIFPGAWHNLLKEKESYRLPFLTHLTRHLSKP